MKREQPKRTRAWFPTMGKPRNRLDCSRLARMALSLWLLAGPASVSAAPVTQEHVAKAVETWVRYVTADARPDAVIERLEPYQEDGVTRAYVAHLANGGYCLAGADSLVLPVYFYCPKGVYDPKNPSCRDILREIADRQRLLEGDTPQGAAVRQANQAKLADRARLWQDLVSGDAAAAKGHRQRGGPRPLGGPNPVPVKMKVPVTCQWGQVGGPWADDCPTLPAGGPSYTVAGCVATAMAQAMYYWRWPNSGVGSGTDTDAYEYRGTSTPVTTALSFDPASLGRSFPYGVTNSIPSPLWGELSYKDGLLTMTGWWDDGVVATWVNNCTNASWSASQITAYSDALTSLYNRLTHYATNCSADYTVPIDWSAMQDTYTNQDNPPVDKAESQVAYLLYEVGVAVQMGYGITGSGAYDTAVPPALTNHFRYDPAAFDDADFNYSSANVNRIVEELQWLRPLLFGGSGHTWLVSGYDLGHSVPLFWMNMGWGLGSSGWYTLDDSAGHKNISDYLYGIAPLGVVGFVGASSSGNGSPNSPYQNLEQALAQAPDDATLIFQAGSVIELSSVPLTINRPLTLKGCQVTITH